MRFLFCLLLLFSTLPSNALETKIYGKISSFNGKHISANTFSDYITNVKTQLQQTQITNGEFVLTFDISETSQIVLQIENKETSFFAEAGFNYHIKLDYNEEANRARPFDKKLDIRFDFPKPNETNTIIQQFNKSYQTFFAENYAYMAVKKATKEIEAFIDKSEQNNSYFTNQFTSNYVTYALANLKDISNFSRTQLYDEHLKNKKILHRHKEYMNFFVQYYQKDFEKYCLSKAGTELKKALMFDQSLTKSTSLIMEHKNIESKELAELYLLYGLYESYHKRTINQKSSLLIINEIAFNGNSLANKTTAKNVLKKLSLYTKSKKAPDFNLLNQFGESKSLKDYNGKYLYIGFWANWSIPSLKELFLMKELHKKYGKKVHFVSINLDEDPEEMLNFLKENDGFKWDFMHYANHWKIREDYEARTVPTYYLIDKRGTIIQAFAPSPIEIERTLFKLK